MIISLIIIGAMQLLAWVFSLFNFIALPLWITQGLASAVDFMMLPFGVVANYLGSEFLSAILMVIIIVFPLLYTWILLDWVLRKIGILKT
jgi:hypothetical protein